MVLLHSGPAKTDSLWNLGFTLLCVGFIGWFLYDATGGYRNKNRAEATTLMRPLYDKNEVVPTEWGEYPLDPVKSAEALRKLPLRQISEVEAQLGAPAKLVKESVPGESMYYFVSDYGKVEVPVVNSLVNVAGIKGNYWSHSAEAIREQYYWALIPLAVLIYILPKLIRSLTLRADIDDNGMTYGGKRIPFSAMVSLRDYSKKGWVDLYYRDGEQESKLRIDNQKIAKFNEIIDVLCAKTGFPDPIRAAEEDGDEQDDGDVESDGSTDQAAQ